VGDVQTVSALLSNGVPADCVSSFGRTPAHVAARNGDHAMLRCLHDHGADLTRKLMLPGPGGGRQQKMEAKDSPTATAATAATAAPDSGDSAFLMAVWNGHFKVSQQSQQCFFVSLRTRYRTINLVKIS
jgi:hypothetical protein